MTSNVQEKRFPELDWVIVKNYRKNRVKFRKQLYDLSSENVERTSGTQLVDQGKIETISKYNKWNVKLNN